MLQLSIDEWERRVNQAKILCARGKECPMCGGTGAWPGLSGFIVCKPCSGTGEIDVVRVSENRL